MNVAKVYHLSENGSEERGGVSRAHLHLKRHARIQLALAVFDRVKMELFYTTIEKFQPNYVRLFFKVPLLWIFENYLSCSV